MRCAAPDNALILPYRANPRRMGFSGTTGAVVKKVKGKREPRLPVMTGLPATFAEAEAATNINAIDHWYVKIEEKLKAWASDAGRLHMQNDLIQQLQTQSSLTIADVIYMADAGHVPAINALRVHIGTHLDQGGKWEDLPDQLRGWGINKMMLQPVVSSYRGGGHMIVDTWARDTAITALMDLAMNRLSLPQQRAAGFVAVVVSRHGIKLKRQQIERIYRDRSTMPQRIAAFMGSTQL
jgi:hypothetical protein